MIERTDFSLPDADEAPAPEVASAQPPVIVIEYRQRGLAARLTPPALILFAALAVSSYQRKTPVWPIPLRPQAVASASPGTPPAADPVRPGIDETKPPEAIASRSVGPIAVAESPAPPPSPPGEPLKPKTGVDRQPSPFDLDPDDGLRPMESSSALAAISSEAAPVPAEPSEAAPTHGLENNTATPPETTEPSRDEILRDIEREAEQKDASRQNLEGLKSRARSLLQDEALARVEAGRAPFRDELKQLLLEFGNRPDLAGEEIESLCDRYGKEPLPEVKKAYTRVLLSAPKRMTRATKVELMRNVGVPEPLILEQLCHDFDKLVNTRGGPRDSREVRVRAARALLAIPLTAPRRPAPTSGETR